MPSYGDNGFYLIAKCYAIFVLDGYKSYNMLKSQNVISPYDDTGSQGRNVKTSVTENLVIRIKQ